MPKLLNVLNLPKIILLKILSIWILTLSRLLVVFNKSILFLSKFFNLKGLVPVKFKTFFSNFTIPLLLVSLLLSGLSPSIFSLTAKAEISINLEKRLNDLKDDIRDGFPKEGFENGFESSLEDNFRDSLESGFKNIRNIQDIKGLQEIQSIKETQVKLAQCQVKLAQVQENPSQGNQETQTKAQTESIQAQSTTQEQKTFQVYITKSNQIKFDVTAERKSDIEIKTKFKPNQIEGGSASSSPSPTSLNSQATSPTTSTSPKTVHFTKNCS